MKNKILRALVILIVMTVGSLAAGSLLWVVFAALEHMSTVFKTALELAWQLIINNWQVMLIVAAIAVITTIVADIIDRYTRKK